MAVKILTATNVTLNCLKEKINKSDLWVCICSSGETAFWKTFGVFLIIRDYFLAKITKVGNKDISVFETVIVHRKFQSTLIYLFIYYF